MSARILGVIPARLASTRLPRKPLHLIAGRPLIEWVWRRAIAAELFDRVVIATDSSEIVQVAEAFGAQVELTDPDHPSGTDRVAEIARRKDFSDYGIVVNVQGDEPFVRAGHLRPAIDLVRTGGWPIGTAATRVRSLAEWLDPSSVKVVRASDGGALLFSRAPVPYRRDGEPTRADFDSGAFLRHLGIYVYSREALTRWVDLPEGTLERIERLEQLRPLAAGIRIGVAVVDPIDGGVDTPADAAAAEARLHAEESRFTDTSTLKDQPAR